MFFNRTHQVVFTLSPAAVFQSRDKLNRVCGATYRVLSLRWEPAPAAQGGWPQENTKFTHEVVFQALRNGASYQSEKRTLVYSLADALAKGDKLVAAYRARCEKQFPACPDCGAAGERRGHQECQYPSNTSEG